MGRSEGASERRNENIIVSGTLKTVIVEGIRNEIALFEIKPSFIGCIIVGLKKLPANGY